MVSGSPIRHLEAISLMSANTVSKKKKSAATATDHATSIYRWQRALFFRPWYQDATVAELGCADGAQLGYAASFAASATGYGDTPDAEHYDHARFVAEGDDWKGADLVLCHDLIDRCESSSALLADLASARGTVVVASRNGIRMSADAFVKSVRQAFAGKTIQFLHQLQDWPANVRPGTHNDAVYTIAVIGDRQLPSWPKLGLVVPTVNGAGRVRTNVSTISQWYPGEVQFLVVANGCETLHLNALKALQREAPHLVTLIESDVNLGYGKGVNLGWETLIQDETIDLFGVSNDDVLPSRDCLSGLVSAYQELVQLGHKPGLIAPVSNEVQGVQKVNIGSYDSADSMLDVADIWLRDHHSAASLVAQVRGLFWLMPRHVLEEIGGFDPIFGLGNFEDDDYSLRVRLAGHTLWVVEGSFLHHDGSETFRHLKIPYEGLIERNIALFCEKWGFNDFAQILSDDNDCSHVPLYIPFAANAPASGHRVVMHGQVVDLVHQATDMEFVAFVHACIENRPREERLAILEILADRARASEAAAA